MCSFQDAHLERSLTVATHLADSCARRCPAYCLYTAAFRRLLRDSGVKPLVLPAWSPNLRFFTEVSAFPLDEENVPHHVPIGSDEQWPI